MLPQLAQPNRLGVSTTWRNRKTHGATALRESRGPPAGCAHEARVLWTDARSTSSSDVRRPYQDSEDAVRRVRWEVCGDGKRPRAALETSDGVWIRLVERPGATSAEGDLRAFMDDGNQHVYEAEPLGSADVRNRVDFDRERQISILDRDQGERCLKLERTPKSGRSELVITANTWSIHCQLQAIGRLRDAPLSTHRPLLRLFEATDHARWNDVRPTLIEESGWMILTEADRAGTADRTAPVRGDRSGDAGFCVPGRSAGFRQDHRHMRTHPATGPAGETRSALRVDARGGGQRARAVDGRQRRSRRLGDPGPNRGRIEGVRHGEEVAAQSVREDRTEALAWRIPEAGFTVAFAAGDGRRARRRRPRARGDRTGDPRCLEPRLRHEHRHPEASGSQAPTIREAHFRG